MGHSFLTQVYTQDYAVGPDTFKLFMTEDQSGEKFVKWSGIAAESVTPAQLPKDISLDADKVIAIASGYYGDIVVALKGGQLAGIINMTEGNLKFYQTWLSAME